MFLFSPAYYGQGLMIEGYLETEFGNYDDDWVVFAAFQVRGHYTETARI